MDNLRKIIRETIFADIDQGISNVTPVAEGSLSDILTNFASG